MYLLDSNIYINFYDRYYKMNYFPTFWSALPSILNSNVKIAEVILDENYHHLKNGWHKTIHHL